MCSLANKRVLIIAFADDYPSEERPTAGPFIKEFVRHIGIIYDCKVMLVERKFTGILGFTKGLLNKAGRRFLPGTFKKEFAKGDGGREGKDSVLTVKYPVMTLCGVPLHLFDGISTVCKAVKVLERSNFRPDVIQTFKSFPPGYIGWKLKKRLGVPVVNMEYQGPFSSYSRARYQMRRALAAISNIDRTVYTKFQVHTIRSYGIPDDKLGYAHFGVDTEKFLLDDRKLRERRKEMLAGRPRLLVIGRVEEEKGFKYLVDSMSILAEEYPEIQLSISGPKGNCFEWVAVRVKTLNIERNVRYLGFVKEGDLPGVINRHDIIIVASILETFGMTILEALSCGKPVVATKCGGPEEIINEYTGVLVPVRDSHALAAGIGNVIRNYDTFAPMKIRQYACDNFGYAVVREKFRNLYEELLYKEQ